LVIATAILFVESATLTSILSVHSPNDWK